MLDTSAAAPAKDETPKQAIALIPAWGRNKDGKPFLGLNMRLGDSKPFPVREQVLEALYGSSEVSDGFRESLRKAMLWRATHVAFVDETTNEVVPKQVRAGSSARVTTGESF